MEEGRMEETEKPKRTGWIWGRLDEYNDRCLGYVSVFVLGKVTTGVRLFSMCCNCAAIMKKFFVEVLASLQIC